IVPSESPSLPLCSSKSILVSLRAFFPLFFLVIQRNCNMHQRQFIVGKSYVVWSGVDPGFSEPARTKHGPRSDGQTTLNSRHSAPTVPAEMSQPAPLACSLGGSRSASSASAWNISSEGGRFVQELVFGSLDNIKSMFRIFLKAKK
ncbi:MAG: hypothetical protein RLY47_582, partial [Candidatus Parcubacteria bacterium]